MKVYSPVTGSEAVRSDDVSIAKIVQKYESEGIDVSEYFRGIDSLSIYECQDTKYRFFYPFITGDEAFYARLQQITGYYPGWKWENEVAAGFINESDKILDIGCGEGFFLDQIREKKQCVVTGLEFNQKAVDACHEKGIDAYKVPVGEFADARPGEFDAVCMFQVLEHIVDVKDFLDSAVRMLKKNGVLIIGVPNNTPYIFMRDKYCTLNLPPHHIGLWNQISLRNIGGFFEMTPVEIIEEPSGAYIDYYSSDYLTVAADNAPASLVKSAFRVLNIISELPLIRRIKRPILNLFSGSLPGHSIVAVYRKT